MATTDPAQLSDVVVVDDYSDEPVTLPTDLLQQHPQALLILEHICSAVYILQYCVTVIPTLRRISF